MACNENSNSGRPETQELHLPPELVPKEPYSLRDTFQEGDENTSLSICQDLISRPNTLQHTRRRLHRDGTPDINDKVITTPTQPPAQSDLDLEGSDTQEEDEKQTPNPPVLFSLSDRQLVKRFDSINAKIQTTLTSLDHYQGRTLKFLSKTKFTTMSDTL